MPLLLRRGQCSYLDDNAFADQGATAPTIREWLVAGKVHSWQPTTGPAQICLTSLLKCFEPAEA